MLTQVESTSALTYTYKVRNHSLLTCHHVYIQEPPTLSRLLIKPNSRGYKRITALTCYQLTPLSTACPTETEQKTSSSTGKRAWQVHPADVTVRSYTVSIEVWGSCGHPGWWLVGWLALLGGGACMLALFLFLWQPAWLQQVGAVSVGHHGVSANGSAPSSRQGHIYLS